VIHRHLEVPQDTRVEDLGLAALDDLLDRGDLADWAPLARAVAADPFGHLAESVMRLCDAHPMYGTSTLWKSWIATLRQPEATAGEEKVGLAGLRRSRGLSQAQLGRRLGITQSDVSKLERRPDVRLSTLRAAVRAMGGDLRIEAVFPDGTAARLNVGPPDPRFEGGG
jgi:DNA-binding XRE family transcriptional regulator